MMVEQVESGMWQVVEILDSGHKLGYNVYSTKRKALAAIRRMDGGWDQ